MRKYGVIYEVVVLSEGTCSNCQEMEEALEAKEDEMSRIQQVRA